MPMKAVKHAAPARKMGAKKKQAESGRMKRPMGLEKPKGQKTRS